jgi:hypothetical protein
VIGVAKAAASSDDFRIALVGLVGVIIGSLITTGFGYVMEGRKERKEVLRAARAIDADLMFAEIVVRSCIEKKVWWPHAMRLGTDGWTQYRDQARAGVIRPVEGSATISITRSARLPVRSELVRVRGVRDPCGARPVGVHHPKIARREPMP